MTFASVRDGGDDVGWWPDAPAGRPPEMTSSQHTTTGTWSVVFGLAPDWAQGQYQGAYFTGRQIGDMVAPPLLAACVIGVGVLGWAALAVLFVVAGLTYPAIVQWGLRTRPMVSGETRDLAAANQA